MKRLLAVLYVVVVATSFGLSTGALIAMHPLGVNELAELIVVIGFILAFLAQICGLSQKAMWVWTPMIFFMAFLLIVTHEWFAGTVFGSLYVLAVIVVFIPEDEHHRVNGIR